MKIICHREGLLSACQLVNVAVAPKNVNPVLQNMKLAADKDKCTLMATDTEVGIRMDVRSITVKEPGQVLLPAARILSILRESYDEEVTLDATSESCRLLGQRMEYELLGEDPSVFPEFPSFAEEHYHQLNGGALREMIRRTQFAVSNPDKTTKWGATTGILWEMKGENIRLVTTDGRRMAISDGHAAPHGDHGTGEQMPVAPLKAMTLLERNLQEDEEPVQVGIRPNEMLIKTERATIYTRLVEGRFPNYDAALPKSANVKIPITAGPFLIAVRQAAIMTSEESMGVVFNFADNKLTLKARGADTGSSKVEMDLEYGGDPIEISFDPKYLTDMLRVFEPETAFTLELIDGETAAVFRHEAGDYRYVVLPLVVRDKSKKP